MRDTGLQALVWFTVTDSPRLRTVFQEGRTLFVWNRSHSRRVPIDTAMGWVFRKEVPSS